MDIKKEILEYLQKINDKETLSKILIFVKRLFVE